MSREEIVQQLAERGIDTADAQSTERLEEMLAAVTAAEQAEKAAEADGAGEAMTPAEGDTVSSEPPATPKEPEAPAKGRGGRRSQPEKDPTELVSCVLGPRSPAGRLLVGNAAIEAKKPGRIPRGEFERLQAEYDLTEVEG